MDAQTKRSDVPIMCQVDISKLGAMIIALTIYSSSFSVLEVDPLVEMGYLLKYMNILKRCEAWSNLAGKFWRAFYPRPIGVV
jgi:hypothetical protein